MRLPGRFGTALISFVVGATIGYFAWFWASTALALVFPAGGASSSESRVTSPDHRFDAVMVMQDYGGAMGGFEYHVYIVRRGAPVRKGARSVFEASDLSGENLVWESGHLLELEYNEAEIESFRNLWRSDEVENVGSYGENDYYVEIRLAPSSEYSLLNPGGGFRSR